MFQPSHFCECSIMPAMKFLSAQRWGSRRQWSCHHGSCANGATHRQHFSRLSSKCPGGRYHSSLASAQGPWAAVPWLTLQCFWDSRETWEPLLSFLDIGQTFFLLSFLSCDCDKTLSLSGSELARCWARDSRTLWGAVPSRPRFAISLSLADLSFPSLCHPCLFGGHVSNVILDIYPGSSQRKSHWPIFKVPKGTHLERKGNFLQLIVLFMSLFPVYFRLNYFYPK